MMVVCARFRKLAEARGIVRGVRRLRSFGERMKLTDHRGPVGFISSSEHSGA